jgi:hypothetical protein
MPLFTVEVTLTPVTDDDWSLLRSVTDAVPGTILLEDPEAPRLMIPVEAESPLKAATFVDGVSQVIGFEVLNGTIFEPDDDFDVPDDGEDESPATTVAVAVQEWFDHIPPVRGASSASRVLLDA